MAKKCFKVKAHTRKGKKVDEHVRCVDKKTQNREKSITYQQYVEKFKQQQQSGDIPKNVNPDDVLKLTGVSELDKINEIKFSASYDQLGIAVKTDDYYVDRLIDYESMSIKNSIFTVNKTGSGTGLKVFSRQVNEAQSQGFKYIDTYAVTKLNDQNANGYYTWARIGFNPEDGWLEKFNSYSPQFKGIKDFNTLFKTKEGIEYWKEEGMSFHGRFDLSANSQSMKTFNDYKKEKKYEGRSKPNISKYNA
jgi:hypothetical protein